MVFAIRRHESAMGAHVSPHPETPFYLPPHPIPLGCPRVPALSALLQAYKENQTYFKQFFFFFLSSFRFSAKLKNYRDSQYPSCCNVCRTSLFSKIPHQNGTLVATEQPTLTHPYHTEPIVYLRIHVYLLCSLWIWTNVKRQVFTVIVSYRVVLLP